jgi:hypothetical protein
MAPIIGGLQIQKAALGLLTVSLEIIFHDKF